MTAVIAVIPNIPRFETVKVAPVSSGGVAVRGPDALGETPAVSCDLTQRLDARVGDRGHDQPIVGCDRDADVHVIVELERAVLERAVDERMVRKRREHTPSRSGR